MPALRANVPFPAYCRINAVNWSSLKLMDESPLAYRYHQDHDDDSDTPARRIGRLAHTLSLEPEAVSSRYAVYEGERRAGPQWKAFVAANPGQEVVKASEIGEARSSSATVLTHPLLAAYRLGAAYELTATWTDEVTGLRCKARPDWLCGDVLLDLKTTQSINALRFTSQAEKLGYFCQLAHYRNGLEACGHPVKRLLIVAVEKKPPFDLAVFELTDAAVTSAAMEVAELLRRLKACQDSGRWLGRYESEQALERPDWARQAELSITLDEE